MRKVRLFLYAIALCVVVLICLGLDSYTWNMIVWPWNIYLFLLVLILLYHPASAGEKVRFRLDTATLATIALFSVAPALALFGWWHSYPSFKLYSGNTKRAEVIFSQNENMTGLPNNLGQLIGRAQRLPLVDWTAHEFELVYLECNRLRIASSSIVCPLGF